MTPAFVPPSPSDWQGPAPAQASAPSPGFTPPPPSSWQGPAGSIGPQFPQAPGSARTQAQTDAAFRSVGRQALDYLPAIGATAGALLAPEAALPAIGFAALGGGAGEAARQGMLAGTGDPEAPQSFGQAAANVGESAATQGAMEAGGRAIAWPVEKLASKMLSPSALYARELKPSTALKPAEANARVATGLREGIPVSPEGYQQAGQRAHEVAQQMEDTVRNSPQAQTALVNPMDIAQRLDGLADSPWAKQALNADDLATLRKAKADYLAKHGTTTPAQPASSILNQYGQPITPAVPSQFTPQMMTPVETMEEKQATYKMNRQKYNAAQAGGAAIDSATDIAEKTLARGAKEQLVALYPELQSLGERDGSLIDLEQSLRQQVGRERNRNGIGLRSAILGAGAIAGLATGHAESGIGAGMLGLALNALDDPAVKSKLAIALARAGKSPVGAAAQYLKPSKSLPIAIRFGQAVIAAQQPQDGSQQ
jgi:hypothetical protein